MKLPPVVNTLEGMTMKDFVLMSFFVGAVFGLRILAEILWGKFQTRRRNKKKPKRPTLKILRELDRLIPKGEGAACLNLYCDNSWSVTLYFQGDEFATMNGYGQIVHSIKDDSQWVEIETEIYQAATELWNKYYPAKP